MGIVSWIKSRSIPLYRSHTPSGVGGPRSLWAEPGRVSPHMEEIRQAAADDVERLRDEDEKYFGPDAPGDSGTG